jgi:hypothetical protein
MQTLTQTESQRQRRGLPPLRKPCEQGLKPFTVVFFPYHFANGKPTCQSADFYPNTRHTHKLMALSMADAELRFARDVNREIKAVHEVTV